MTRWRASGGVVLGVVTTALGLAISIRTPIADRLLAALADLSCVRSWMRAHFERMERQRAADVLIARELEREACALAAEACAVYGRQKIAAAIRARK